MRIPDRLYQTVVQMMPIPCVDLVIRDEATEILLVRRRNQPARDEWWFPGGRVHFGETRVDAAQRKLAEECGLRAVNLEELWTADVILPLESNTSSSHGITTLYAITVQRSSQVSLDDQAVDFAWKKAVAWEKESLHPFVRETLRCVRQHFAAQAAPIF
jgi:colanic acid biosynthesis protein WcaH